MSSLSALGRIAPAAVSVRRFEPARDLRELVELLELGFADDLEEHDRRWLSDLMALSTAGRAFRFMLRLLPQAAHGFGGYVCLADGRLVGNVTLVRHGPETWSVANVVTRPGYRRRGIARRLMAEAIAAATAAGTQELFLQVRQENGPAHRLYDQLGFRMTGASTAMRLESTRQLGRESRSARDAAVLIAALDGPGGRAHRAASRRSEPGPSGEWRSETRHGGRSQSAGAPRTSAAGHPVLRVHARAWRGADDARVRRLLARAGSPAPYGPQALIRRALASRGVQSRVEDWLQGRSRACRAVDDGEEYRAAAVVQSDDGQGPVRLEAIVDPTWCGSVEDVLVSDLARRIPRRPEREVLAVVAAEAVDLMERLGQRGFEPTRTLDHMVLDL